MSSCQLLQDDDKLNRCTVLKLAAKYCCTWWSADAYSKRRRQALGRGDGERLLQQRARLGAVRLAGGLDEGDCAAEVQAVAARVGRSYEEGG
jgi:hypothetical protein